jgi:hypothetical protein
MGFEKEVSELLNKDYSSLDEKEIVTKFCKSLNDSNNTLLEANYYSYYSYKRNCINHNEDSFEMVEKIYKKLKFTQL